MRIAVALSGGVDSSAAALLLKKAGHDVHGIHMLLHAGAGRARAHAESMAAALGIPLHIVDMAAPFSAGIIEPFVREYAAGRTPSPCPRCNAMIKTGALLDIAASMGFEKLATGHYAILETEGGRTVIRKGVDPKKDQSYFLCMIPRTRLNRLLFPLGGFRKQEVRDFLAGENIPAAAEEESQELCFVPDGSYREFLREHGVHAKPGPILNLRGETLGFHEGIGGFTVGQRKGLGICGPTPLYVLRIDAPRNAIVVGPREATYSRRVHVAEVNVQSSCEPRVGDRCTVKIRSTARPVPCCVTENRPDGLILEFDEPQSSVAPGQAAAVYEDNRVVAGGWIVGPWSVSGD